MAPHVGRHDIADRQQMRAAMVIDDALGVARRAGGVVERYGVPFVRRGDAFVVLIAFRKEGLVFDLAEPFARAVIFGIVVIDDERARSGELQRGVDHGRELAVGDEDLRLAVVEHESESRGVEPGVERVEHRAAHRHAVMAFEHGRRVGEHRRDGVAALHAAPGQRRSQAPRAGKEVTVVSPQGAVDDGGSVRKNRCRALEQRERSERLIICRVLVEIGVVGRNGHGGLPFIASIGEARSRRKALIAEPFPERAKQFSFSTENW